MALTIQKRIFCGTVLRAKSFVKYGAPSSIVMRIEQHNLACAIDEHPTNNEKDITDTTYSLLELRKILLFSINSLEKSNFTFGPVSSLNEFYVRMKEKKIFKCQWDHKHVLISAK